MTMDRLKKVFANRTAPSTPRGKSRFWYKTLIVLSGLFFLQIVSAFSKDGLFLGHDSQLHLIYLKHFEEAARNGQFPVRIIDWFVPGLNQPLFNFYQPGINYLYLIPRSLGLSYTSSLEILVVSLWLLSSLLMFLFTKRHFGTLAGILAAYMYLLAPYHILDILIRSALPEFTALAFIPGVFWAIKCYYDTRRGFYLSLVSVFIALVTVSHPPTIIMFSPVILAYLLYLLFLEKSLSLLLPLIASFVIGLGLVSFFLLPAFFEQQYVQTLYMRSGYYDFHNHFVCFPQLFSTFWGHGTSQTGCTDGMSFQLGIVHWFAIFITTLLLLIKFFVKKKQALASKFLDITNINQSQSILLSICIGLIFLYVCLMLNISQPVWETLPYISYIQYPWRFLAPTIFLASFTICAVIVIIKKEEFKYAAFIILMIAIGLAYSGYLKPIAYASRDEINFGNEILHDSISGIKYMTPEPGFMPKWTEILPADNDRPASEVRYATQEAKLNNYNIKATHKTYQFNSIVETIVRFYTHYFPGWEVTVNDKKVDPEIDNIYGYMDVPLPAGQSRVTLTFKNTKIRSLANTLSINFAVSAFALAFIFNKKRQQ